jgi:hypothetical protein
MFCPQCGTETQEQLKFCKKCGANLRRVMGVMGKGGAGGGRRELSEWEQEALDEQRAKRGRSPEEKRYDEIKTGVITSSVGLGVMIFLGILFAAISKQVPEARDILNAIPFIGVIPFLIGLGMIINGLFVSKKVVELKRREQSPDQNRPYFQVPETSPVPRLSALRSEENGGQPVAEFSVVDQTTKTLREPVPVPSSSETDR